MNKIKPLKRKSLSDEIIESIIILIKSGSWVAGQKIPGEIQLANDFNVSRNIMRESLKSLELFGLLKSFSGKGTYLTDSPHEIIAKMEFYNILIDNQNLDEILEIRLIIEPALARLAAIHRTDEDLKNMEYFLELSYSRYNNKEVVSDIVLNEGVEFHNVIAKASQNLILNKFLNSLISEIRAARYHNLNDYIDEKNILEDLSSHKLIIDVIKKQDEEAAYNLMYQHIKNRILFSKSEQ